MRKLVIGDIHGGWKALLQVLSRSNFDITKDQLICLGDYVDGWSQSSEVFDLLINIKEKTKGKDNQAVFIRGNHDEWAESYLLTSVAKHEWISQGGKATYDSFKMWFEARPQDRVRFYEFLRGCYNFYVDDDNRGFVHGGYKSMEGLGNESYHSTYYWDRNLWQTVALPGHSAAGEMPRLLRPHKEIYIGHTSTMFWNKDVPMNACNVWNLDTGGGWHGKLTIMDIDTKEYWQSDTVKELYPEEKGR